MLKKIDCACSEYPECDVVQTVYNLGPKFYIALLQLKFVEPHQLQLHIKLCEKETRRFICIDKIILLELCSQLRQLENVNIVYPCTVSRDLTISVKSTTIPGEYQVNFNRIKLVLDSWAVKNLLLFEPTIYKYIREAEYHHIREGYDVPDGKTC